MKTVRIGATPSGIGPDAHPMQVAEYVAAYLSSKSSGGVFAEWDDASNSGLWFYSGDGRAVFRTPRVDEVIFREHDRGRFRSVIFRLGSAASEEPGGLCGVMRMIPEGADATAPPKCRYFVHASFAPEAGLWFRATIVSE
jgi:hypothetical protein